VKRQCRAKTKAGARCASAAGPGGTCFTHDASRAEERAAARKLGGYHRKTAARVSGEAAPQIITLADVLKLINAVIVDTWALENTSARSRALLALGEGALKVLEACELEARLEALERKTGITT